MFRGSSFHNIDEKGRILIPARFRDVIRAGGNESLMVSRMDGCLVAYSLEEWSNIEKKILEMAQKSADMRRFRRVFIGGASHCAFDKQGRVLIPSLLRGYGDLEKEIVLVGVLDHFEIWSREKWDKENLHLEEDLEKEELRNEVALLGL